MCTRQRCAPDSRQRAHGALTVLAEGHPGIGKTTAVRDWLQAQTSGFLFVYRPAGADQQQRAQRSGAAQTAIDGAIRTSGIHDPDQQPAAHHQRRSPPAEQHPGAATYQGAVIFAGTTPAFVIPDPARAPFLSAAAQPRNLKRATPAPESRPGQCQPQEIRNKALPGVFRTLGTAAHAMLWRPTNAEPACPDLQIDLPGAGRIAQHHRWPVEFSNTKPTLHLAAANAGLWQHACRR